MYICLKPGKSMISLLCETMKTYCKLYETLIFFFYICTAHNNTTKRYLHHSCVCVWCGEWEVNISERVDWKKNKSWRVSNFKRNIVLLFFNCKFNLTFRIRINKPHTTTYMHSMLVVYRNFVLYIYFISIIIIIFQLVFQYNHII
jgi:hypothetical protein